MGDGPAGVLTVRSTVVVVGAVLLVVVVGVAVLLGVRDRVHLSPQGGALSGAFVHTAEADLDERLLYGVPAGVTTMVAVDAVPGEAVAVSFWRNDGPVPVTLVAPDAQGGYDPWPMDLVVGDGAAGTSFDDALSAPGARRVSVRPGEAAGIRFTLDDPCLQPAFPFGPTTAVLEATALGITRTVALALDPVPLMMSTTDPPDSCR